LSVHELKLSVFEIGLQDHAGLNVSTPLGTLSTGGSAAANTQTILNTNNMLDEITHTAPKEQVGGVTEFSLLWTAPASDGTANILAWGNAVNFNGNTLGDAASATLLQINVGATPPPTDTPGAVTPTPTPTSNAAGLCPAVPDLGGDESCLEGFAKGLLLVKESVSGHEKLVAKLISGPALTQTSLGNPLDVGQGGTGTSYALCIYDIFGDLAGELIVDRAGDLCAGAPCWKPVGKAPNDPQGPGKGYKYKDDAVASDGVLKIIYKGGDAGKSKALMIAKGPSIPAGIPAALQTSSQVTVQLHSSDGVCISVDLSQIKKQEALFFKAK